MYPVVKIIHWIVVEFRIIFINRTTIYVARMIMYTSTFLTNYKRVFYVLLCIFIRYFSHKLLTYFPIWNLFVRAYLKTKIPYIPQYPVTDTNVTTTTEILKVWHVRAMTNGENIIQKYAGKARTTDRNAAMNLFDRLHWKTVVAKRKNSNGDIEMRIKAAVTVTTAKTPKEERGRNWCQHTLITTFNGI